MLMKVVLGVVLATVLVVLMVLWLGSRLPREHKASVSAYVNESCEVVFARITNVEALPQWRKDLKSVERVSTHRYRETTSWGPMTYDVAESTPGRRLVTKIVEEPGAPFGGQWTFELEPKDTGCTVRITEDGWVGPAFYRFVTRYVMGEDRTLRAYLDSLTAAPPRR